MTLKDGAKKIFFNSKSYDQESDPDIQAFLKYVNGENSANSFIQEIEERVEQIKENREWRREYMTLQMREQEIREESLKEGRKEGREEGIKAMIGTLQELELPEEKIIEKLMKAFHLKQAEAKNYLY